MSPKLALWLAVSLLSILWYTLDPEAGGPSAGARTHAVPVTKAVVPALIPQVAGNR